MIRFNEEFLFKDPNPNEWFKDEPEIRNTIIHLETILGLPFKKASKKITSADIPIIRSLIQKLRDLNFKSDDGITDLGYRDIINRLKDTLRDIIDR